MDLEVARKVLSKRGTFSSKRVAFFVVAGLSLVLGILLRSGQYFGQPEVAHNAPVTVAPPPPSAGAPATPAVETTESVPKTPPTVQEPATAPNEQAAQTGEAVEQAEQADGAIKHAEQPKPPGSGMILVSRRPVEVLASPSPSAPTMYGFPAGRPFRVIGRDGGFAQIQDLKSGPAAGSMRPRSRRRRACRPSPRRLSRSLPRSAGSLQSRRPIPSQKRPRRTVKSPPTRKQPPNRIRSKRAGALAYLAEGVSSGASSATATNLA
jgi:hypothetical protein